MIYSTNMSPFTQNCQNCKSDFFIDQEDLDFYSKIEVPPPTFCPECRMIRRMAWRNVRSLYRRECGLCQKVLIAGYSDDGAPVYCNECWNGDKWDAKTYGRAYDFTRNFFVQLKELWDIHPRIYQYRSGTLINSDFSNYTINNKNAYLSYSITDCEDTMYSETIDKSKNSIDCYAVTKIDGCYYNVDCEGNYNVSYGVESQTCIDSYFIYDCANCSDCCLSSNQRNAQYVFRNQKLTKEEYKKAVQSLRLDTYSGMEAAKNEFERMMREDAIHRYAFIYSSQVATGDYIHHARNAKQCFDTNNFENVAYSVRAIAGKDSYDLQGCGFNIELIYESVAASVNTVRDFFCYITIGCRECEYSLLCRNCVNCFGCVGMTNAQYCIFNKQYTKEEYFSTVKRIKEQMNQIPYVDSKGRVFCYGEFFPFELSPFGYNETNASDFFPLSKDEALAKGYSWKEREKREYQTNLTIQELSDSITETPDSTTSAIIACPNNGKAEFQCATAYKITPEELLFYRQKNLPLPRLCPNCRHYARLKYRNTMRLYKRNCTNNCGREFETTYAPDRPEKVFCEACYQQAVL